MIHFARFLVIACVALLSWWQTDLRREIDFVSVVSISVGIVTIGLTWNCNRVGYGLACLLGLGHLLQVLLLVGPAQWFHVQPLLIWAVGLIISGGGLLWATSEKPRQKPLYERYPEY